MTTRLTADDLSLTFEWRYWKAQAVRFMELVTSLRENTYVGKFNVMPDKPTFDNFLEMFVLSYKLVPGESENVVVPEMTTVDEALGFFDAVMVTILGEYRGFSPDISFIPDGGVVLLWPGVSFTAACVYYPAGRVWWRFHGGPKHIVPCIEDEFDVADAGVKLESIRVWTSNFCERVFRLAPSSMRERIKRDNEEFRVGARGRQINMKTDATAITLSETYAVHSRLVALAETGDTESIRDLRRRRFG